MHSTPHSTREQLTKLAEALYRFSQSLDSAFALHLKQLAVDLAGAIAANDQKAITNVLARAEGVIDLGERVGAIAANDKHVIASAIDRSQGLLLPIPAKKSTAAADVFGELVAEEKKQETVVVEKKEMPREEVMAVEEKKVVEKKEEEVQPVVMANHREEEAEVMPMPVRQTPQPFAVPVGQTRQAQRIATATITMMGTPSAADRQERIVTTIRQNPNARMRDLLAALPGVSERTIRYDLERLVSSGIIEREGVGGPATWYRIR